jgi:hypothetical protein
MALRQGGRALARSLMQAKSALPVRGGGGGPIRYADAPNKQVNLLLWTATAPLICCVGRLLCELTAAAYEPNGLSKGRHGSLLLRLLLLLLGASSNYRAMQLTTTQQRRYNH